MQRSQASLIGKTAGAPLPDPGSVYVGSLLRLWLIEIGREETTLAADDEILLAQPAVMLAIESAGCGRETARVERSSISLWDLGLGTWDVTCGWQRWVCTRHEGPAGLRVGTGGGLRGVLLAGLKLLCPCVRPLLEWCERLDQGDTDGR